MCALAPFRLHNFFLRCEILSSFTFLLLSLSDLLCYIHFACAFKLFGPSVFPPTMTSADFSLFVITTSSLVRPHGISPNTFIVYLQNLHFGFTVTFLSSASLPTCYALYSVPVRQATISLLLPLSQMSPSKTCKSLLDSLVTTLCRDFHPSIKTSPSYQKIKAIYLSVPLLRSFLFDLALSSVLKLFICANIDFLSLS